MTVPPITGDIQLQPDGSVEGWVWSPDLPGQRLVAEILVEDVRIGAMVSAMLAATWSPRASAMATTVSASDCRRAPSRMMAR